MEDGNEGRDRFDRTERGQDFDRSAEIAVEQAERQRSNELFRYEQGLILNSFEPETIRFTTRSMMEAREAITMFSPALEDRYGTINTYHAMRGRVKALKTGRDSELVEYLGLRKDGFAGHRYKRLKVDPKLTGAERREEANRILLQLEEKEDLGDDEIEKRDALITELERGADEIEVREKFNDLWGLYLFVQGNLKEFRRIPFSAENRLPVERDWMILFNLPPEAEAERGVPEAHKERMEGKFGERVDLGVRLYLMAALSERPTELERLRQTPGYRDYVLEPLKQRIQQLRPQLETDKYKNNPVAKELQRLLEQYGDDPDISEADLAEKVFIGDIRHWRTEEEREGTPDEEGGPETIPERRGNRGLLTLHGNIFARKEKRFETEGVNKAVAMILGEDESAQELSRRMFHALNLAPYYGSERDEIEYDERGNIVKQEIDREGAPFSNALERITDLEAFMLYKQKNGEWGGPEIAIRKYPKRLLTSMLKHISVPNPENVRSLTIGPGLKGDDRKAANEKYRWQLRQSERTLWELMWEGWDGERALKMGEMPWKEMTSFFWKDYTIRLNFAGGEGQLFDTLTADPRVWDPRASNFKRVDWWKNHATALRVCLGPWVVPETNQQFGWKEWLDENRQAIEVRAEEVWKKSAELKSKGKKKGTLATFDGARDKAAKEILGEQKKKIIDQTNHTLMTAIQWYYGRIVDRPEDARGTDNPMIRLISQRRVAAGVVLPGEEEVKLSPVEFKIKKRYDYR